MTFLANENFPLSSVRVLKSNGYDIQSVGTNFKGITDQEVIASAMLENRTIITFDRDYGELIFKFGYRPKGGVILFRWNSFSPEEPGEFLVNLMKESPIDFSKSLTVISRNSIRQRKYFSEP